MRIPCGYDAAAILNHDDLIPSGIGNTRDGLHPIQERLAKAHGSQCGFCTSGFCLSMYSLLRSKKAAPTESEIEEALAGNLW